MSVSPKEPQSHPALVLIYGDSSRIGQRWELTDRWKFIGKHFECDIHIDDRHLDRKQAMIAHRLGECVLEDLGGGTRVNGRKIPVAHTIPVHVGDQIEMGSSVFAVFDGDSRGEGQATIHQDRLQSPVPRSAWGTREDLHRLIMGDVSGGKPDALLLLGFDQFDAFQRDSGVYVAAEAFRTMRRLVDQLLESNLFAGAQVSKDEFVVLLKGGSHQRYFEVCSDLLETIKHTPVKMGSYEIRFSVSAALATLALASTYWEQAYRDGAHALYEAKHTSDGTLECTARFSAMLRLEKK